MAHLGGLSAVGSSGAGAVYLKNRHVHLGWQNVAGAEKPATYCSLRATSEVLRPDAYGVVRDPEAKRTMPLHNEVVAVEIVRTIADRAGTHGRFNCKDCQRSCFVDATSDSKLGGRLRATTSAAPPMDLRQLRPQESRSGKPCRDRLPVRPLVAVR